MQNLVVLAVLAAAVVLPGALGQDGRTLKTLNPGTRLVNAQFHLDKQLYKAQVTQVVAREKAIGKVGKTLDKAADREAHLDHKVDKAADHAAALAARASQSGSIGSMKRAALAEIDVEKAIRFADREKAELQAKVDRKIQNTIDWQAKKEDKAAQRVDKAQVRLDKAQVRFDAFLGRKSGGFGGLQLPQLGGFGGGDDGAQAGAFGGLQPGGVPNLPFLP